MSTTNESLTTEERARLQRAIDRIEERTFASAPGIHAPGPTADIASLAASGLPPGAAMVWAQWDGYDVVGGESRLLPLSKISAATQAADDVLMAGDRVIGEAGRDLFVLPEDPWAEGADVVRLEEDGNRLPEASSVAHLLLGLLAEVSVIYDETGEFRDELIGEDAEFTESVSRKLLRRRLDHDPDAPRPRLDLACLLRRAGELRAARRELEGVLKRAPEWCWVHYELAGIAAQEGDRALAGRKYTTAGEHAPDDGLRAFFLAWAALMADGGERETLARRVLALRPDFAAEQTRAAQALRDDDDEDAQAQAVALGLAVAPRNLPLLALRSS